jgi:catechol 2,3-dioxygenase-like lactoylglutathione lyase family enzyme
MKPPHEAVIHEPIYMQVLRVCTGVTLSDMTLKRMDNVGVVVDDLAAAVAFFKELGLELEGEAQVEGRSVDRLIGLDGVLSDIAMMRTPDGHGRVELTKFRRIMFAVEDIDDVVARLRAHGAELVGELVQYENSYRLCYVRGPEGILVALAEKIN